MITKFSSDLESHLIGSTLNGFKGRRKVAGCAKNTDTVMPVSQACN